MKNIKLDRPLEERRKINESYKFLKVAHLRELDQMLIGEEITYSRMVELINEIAYDFYRKELPTPDCHFQDESGEWVWAYSKELIDKTFK